VHLLLEEVVMSRKRMLWSVVVAGALLAGSGILVVQAFPLTPQVPAPSAVPSQAATPGPVQPVVGTQPVTQPWGAAAEQAKRAPQVLQRVTPETVDVTPEPYVVVQAEIGADGHVTTASAVAGEPTLFGGAADAVRQWTFEPTGEPQQMMIGLNLSAGAWEGANAAAPSLRVGGAIKPPQKTKHFPPEYPPEAKEAGVQGIVILEAVIGPTGQVREAHVLRSVPGLDAAALASVLRWGFTPTLLNGAPVPVIMTVTINFTLQ
jgi:TonB family protein